MAKPHKALVVLLMLAGVSHAAILPEQLGPGKRKSVSKTKLSEQKLWNEYGLQESETGDYLIGTGQFAVAAYRLQDPTAALAAFYWQRPKNASASSADKLAGETANDLIVAHDNYLLNFQGFKPAAEDLQKLYAQLPNLDQSPLPALIGHLPTQDRVLNSERYITGPASLEAFFPGIQGGQAAFHLGSEAVVGAFPSSKGEIKLAVFSYPTPNLARERLAEMQQISGALVKRAGPLVAVILSPASADDAERLLSQVRYRATISWSQYVPTRRDNIGSLVIAAFELAGFLLVFATVVGLAFGGLRVLRRRGQKEDPEALTVLSLRD